MTNTDQTEELLAFITRGLDDVVLDDVEVTRIQPQTTIASEPITTAVILGLGTASVYAVARLLEKWLEKRRQEEARQRLVAAWATDPELGRALLDLEKAYSGIVVSQGMPDIGMIGRVGGAG